MSIATTTGIALLPFAERPLFGDPYPIGLAVGDTLITGDATGGTVGTTFLADGSFLFRLEMVQVVKGDGLSTAVNMITAHTMLADRSGRPNISQLNWILPSFSGNGFRVFTPMPGDYAMMHRIPLGRTDRVTAQQLIALENENNVDTISYSFSVVLSYWRQEALFLPGFLQAFWEAPVVATPLRAL